MASVRTLGYLMIVLGIMLLITSFFYSLGHLIGIFKVWELGLVSNFQEISANLMLAISKLLFLGVIVWIGGLLIDRGIKILKEFPKA